MTVCFVAKQKRLCFQRRANSYMRDCLYLGDIIKACGPSLSLATYLVLYRVSGYLSRSGLAIRFLVFGLTVGVFVGGLLSVGSVVFCVCVSEPATSGCTSATLAASISASLLSAPERYNCNKFGIASTKPLKEVQDKTDEQYPTKGDDRPYKVFN